MMLRAVTLDAGGTLFDVAEPVGATYARIAARHGMVATAADLERGFRAAFEAAAPLAFPGVAAGEIPARERAWWRALVRRTLGGHAAHPGFEACFDELFAHYARPEAWRVFPEVPDALARLRAAGLQLAVVSNFDGRLPGLLAGLGLTRLVTGIVHSSRVGAAKPAPAIFRAALALLGVPPTATLHAGDRVVEDVEGALASGLAAALVDRHDRRPPLPPGVVRLCSLADLAH